jgi:tRNA threonylcarbamoyl adenosine modification protein (Sua5/YciO/YrdC/YwlC family)
MSPVYDCTTPEGLAEGVAKASAAVRDGEVVVLPTDTVYGVGADAFSAEAVASVLAAKGRGREMPPPVLVPSVRTVDGLATSVPPWARALIAKFWPGPLTLIFEAQPSLMWDLGDTNGTVALRMPQDDVAIALLSEVGPMAVTSANLTGQPPATTVTDAAAQLGAAVTVYLDGGPTTSNEVSTIVDCTGEEPVVLRAGAISWDDIEDVVIAARKPAEDEAAADEPAADEPAASTDAAKAAADDAIELPADPAARPGTAARPEGDTHER